jgi:hypothetical protein
MKQITHELVIEKLLSMIDLPLLENLLFIDEKNDIEYLSLLDSEESTMIETRNQQDLKQQHNCKSSISKINSSANYVHRVLSILNQVYDLSKCDV